MIVFRIAFFDTIWVGCHPFEVIRKPCFHIVHSGQEFDSPCHLDKMNRVDDAGAASRNPAVNRLRVLKIRIHACVFVYKPRVEMSRRMSSETLILCYRPGGRESRDLNAEAHEVSSMVD